MFSIVVNPRCTAAMVSEFRGEHLACVIAFARERGRWRATRSTWLDERLHAVLDRERVTEEARLALDAEMLLREARRGPRRRRLQPFRSGPKPA